MCKKRNVTLDTAKGILIILMVVGHSGCPSYIADVIYSFHMPCFFLISGMCLSDKYAHKKKLYIRKKISSLYIPFVKWSFCFLLLHNLFYNLHYYENSYDLQLFLRRSLGIVTMTASEQLLGGFWFLKELFYASIIGGFSIFYFYKYHYGSIFIPMLFLLFAYIISMSPSIIPTINTATMLSCSYFTLGYTCKNLITEFRIWKMVLFILTIFICLVPTFYRGSMFSNTGYEVVVYYFISIIGCITLLMISSLLVKLNIHNKFEVIGQATLYILIFHFLSFKIITFCLNSILGMSLPLVQFPVPILKPSSSFVVYVLFGVLIPFGIWETKNHLTSYIHEKYLKIRNYE